MRQVHLAIAFAAGTIFGLVGAIAFIHLPGIYASRSEAEYACNQWWCSKQPLYGLQQCHDDSASKQIEFVGETLDLASMLRWRDRLREGYRG